MAPRIRLAAPILAVTLALAGCTNGAPTKASGPTANIVEGTAAATPAKIDRPALDAKAVLDKLTAAKLGLTNQNVQDEDTDPNKLLGRPNGYTSRASADLPGGDKDGTKYDVSRGLAVEVYPDAAGAEARSKYIQGLLKNAPILGVEYHYLSGSVLVRVAGDVKPSQAKEIGAVVAGL